MSSGAGRSICAWFWSLYGMFGVTAELRSDGQAATLDEAKAQFETA